ncbi:MAG: tryptophanase [Acidobacteria bacterium]|nr:tryptophanase [Acidobacteriota bacterium]
MDVEKVGMDSLKNLLNILPQQASFSAQPRPYVNHSVQFKVTCTAEERAKILQEVGLNVFSFPADMITGCDMLSDSGTTTMTNEQWAALHLGDESYGSNKGYFTLMAQIGEMFGKDFTQDIGAMEPNAFLFHQGRPAEDALFSVLSTQDRSHIIPSNGHFDTTLANIENNGMEARPLFSPKLQDTSQQLFRGDIDILALRKLLASSTKRVPVIFLTITNNTGGGQPVSMQNIKETHALSREFSIPLFFDACRFAENAWFIQHYEERYAHTSIKDIVKEMFSYVDGFTISFKKDGLANMGGGIFLKKGGLFVEKYPHIPGKLMDLQIIKEAHPSYGGLSGRDIVALAEGLRTITKEEYLTARISQVQEFGEEMHTRGLPVLMPIGGHAVYMDMNRFFGDTDMQPEDFGGISFTALLLALYGHRACELGNFAFGHVDEATGREVPHSMNFVRFAVPRLRYEGEDFQSVIAAVEALYEHRRAIPKIDVVYGRGLPLRHFRARFSFRGNS